MVKKYLMRFKMASFFDDPNEYGDGAFITINFNEILPESHPAMLIHKFIESLVLNEFEKKYHVGSGKKGRPPKSIKMMLGVLLYAIYSRIYSAHQIDIATYTYSDFWIFTHKNRISHDTISKFINLHEKEIITVFLATIILAEKNDLLDFETLYQDGFFIKANASKSKSYTKNSLKKKEKKVEEALEEIIQKLKETNDDTDSSEKRKLEKKLEDLHKFQDELNEKIQNRLLGKKPDKVDKDKITINTTDSDCSLMKMKDKSYANAYLKITAVDSKRDIVVGSILEGYYDEPHRSVQLFQQSNSNCEGLGNYASVCFDAGFNTMGTCSWFKVLGVDVIAPTKQHENEVRHPKQDAITFDYNEDTHKVTCSEGATLFEYSALPDHQSGSMTYSFRNKDVCKKCSRLSDCTTSKRKYRSVQIDSRYLIQKAVLERYKSYEGQKIYKKRSHVAETFQGDLKKNGKLERFQRRGKAKVKIESVLHDITWNLRRIFNSKGSELVWT